MTQRQQAAHPSKVRRAGLSEHEEQERKQQQGYWPQVDAPRWLMELESRQAAEVHGWRLRQGILLGAPVLLVGAWVGWVGIRLTRRSRPGGDDGAS